MRSTFLNEIPAMPLLYAIAVFCKTLEYPRSTNPYLGKRRALGCFRDGKMDDVPVEERAEGLGPLSIQRKRQGARRVSACDCGMLFDDRHQQKSERCCFAHDDRILRRVCHFLPLRIKSNCNG